MTTAAMTKNTETVGLPDMKVSVRQVFGIDSDLEVPAYSEVDPHVPEVDSDYRFDRATTLAILAGFAKNRRVMVTGYHGTGKSTHIEQVAARLKKGTIRVARVPAAGADAVITAAPSLLAAVVYGGQPLDLIGIEGDRMLVERFVTLFPLPAKVDAGGLELGSA